MTASILRFGIIGTGSRGIESWGRTFSARPDTRVTALCDTNAVRLREASATLGGGHALYATAAAMLATEPLDAVVVTSPDCWHAEHAVAALEHGRHVLIDKPLATTVAGCQDIIRAAEATKCIAMIGFNLRHDPTLRRLKELVDAGELGRVFLIENREFYNGGRTYMARWNRTYAISGGLWVHKGSHDFDVFNWLLGHPKPVRVSSFAGVNVLDPEHIPFARRPGVEVGPTCHECAYLDICPDAAPCKTGMWSEEARAVDGYAKDLCIYTSAKDTHDNGIALVEYENGARASHLECFITSLTDRLYTVVGERAQAEVSLNNRSIVIRRRWSGELITHQIPPAKGGHGGSDPSLAETFVKVVRGELPNTSTTEHGMWSTAIGQAAEISRREHRMVTIAELFAD